MFGDIMELKILGTGSIYSKRNCSSAIVDKTILIDIRSWNCQTIIKRKLCFK